MIVMTATPELTFRSGPEKGRSVRMKKSIRVGRGDENDVVLRDETLSRLHCSFDTRGTACSVRDLDSTNGTRVNGETVILRRTLAHGDVISIGSTEIEYRESA